jgi:hypothetical protein
LPLSDIEKNELKKHRNNDARSLVVRFSRFFREFKDNIPHEERKQFLQSWSESERETAKYLVQKWSKDKRVRGKIDGF